MWGLRLCKCFQKAQNGLLSHKNLSFKNGSFKAGEIPLGKMLSKENLFNLERRQYLLFVVDNDHAVRL